MTAQNIQQSNRTEQKFFYGYIIVAADFLIMAASQCYPAGSNAGNPNSISGTIIRGGSDVC